MILYATLPFTASAGPQERGMLTGAAIGATAGALIGTETNETAEGAMIGAMFGAIAGALLSDVHTVPSHAQRPQRIVHPVYQNHRNQYRHNELKHRKHHKRMYQHLEREHHRPIRHHYKGGNGHHEHVVMTPSHKYRASNVYANQRFNRVPNHSRTRIQHYARAY